MSVSSAVCWREWVAISSICSEAHRKLISFLHTVYIYPSNCVSFVYVMLGRLDQSGDRALNITRLSGLGTSLTMLNLFCVCDPSH